MKYLVLVFTVLFLASCGGESKPAEPSKNDSIADTNSADNTLDKAYAECVSLKQFQFCAKGLDFIQLGDSLTWKTFKLPGATQKDTVYEEVLGGSDGKESVDWNASIFRFDDGKILLESDFDNDLYLNRVQIETPKYSTPSGLHVGMTLEELLQKEPGLLLKSFPEYNLVEAVLPYGLILQFRNNGYFDSSVKEAAMIAIEKVNSAEKVIRIVIM